jgi:hypothetical protein
MAGEAVMKIEWAEPPRPRQANVFAEFAAELRKHPGRWAKWPRTYSNPTSVGAVRHNIEHKTDKTPANFREGTWEAVVRQGVLYVRYLDTDKET